MLKLLEVVGVVMGWGGSVGLVWMSVGLFLLEVLWLMFMVG